MTVNFEASVSDGLSPEAVQESYAECEEIIGRVEIAHATEVERQANMALCVFYIDDEPELCEIFLDNFAG